MGIQSISVLKALPDGEFEKKVVIDAHRCRTSCHLRHPTSGPIPSSRGQFRRLCVYRRASVRRRATSCGNADAQKADMSSTSIKQQVLSLNFTNNRQHLAATVGQQIEITLGTVGPKQYGTPQVSSPAIQLESVALAWPPNPGGPTYVYIFEATAEGEVQVKIPLICSENPDC